jgi:hypothetical protein
MATQASSSSAVGQKMDDGIKSWIMVALTIVFVGLYGAALIGWLKPLTDDKILVRLEPIIFVIIGYYFGRLPAQQNEKTLKEEIGRQAQKADTAQEKKEQAESDRAIAHEKIKNTKAALGSSVPTAPTEGLATTLSIEDEAVNPAALRQSVIAAIKVLES